MEKCRICNNVEGNNVIKTTEMMFGYNDSFEYIECSLCGCLQIKHIPENISKYYPENYFSYKKVEEPKIERNKLLRYLKKKIFRFHLGEFSLIGMLLAVKYQNPFPYWIKKRTISLDAKILDIGSGSGQNLISLYKIGFTNLIGVDPYIESDIFYKSGIKIFKKNIFEIEDKYDFIMMHHSFEHMENPKEVLSKVYNLLNNKCYLIIRIPISDTFAYKTFGANWRHIDPPRHFYLHTTKSISLLAQQTGFVVKNVEYDSVYTQFSGSIENINPSIKLTDNDISKFKEISNILNKYKDGDYACFYLYKV